MTATPLPVGPDDPGGSATGSVARADVFLFGANGDTTALARALGGAFNLARADALQRSVHPGDTLVIDVRAPLASFCQADMERLRRQNPLVPIVVYAASAGHRAIHATVELIAAGADAVVVAGWDDSPGRATSVVESARAVRHEAFLKDTMSWPLEPKIQEILLACLRHPQTDYTVAALAKEVGMSRTWLNQVLAEAGFSPPRRLISRLRVMVAARMVLSSGRTLDQIAKSLGYADGAGLTQLFLSQVGEAPSSCHTADGYRLVISKAAEGIRRETGAESGEGLVDTV